MASIASIQDPNLNPIQQGIGLGQQLANVQQTDQQTKLMPINSAVGAQNALNQRASTMLSNIRFNNPAFAFYKSMMAAPSSVRASYIAQHPNEWNAIVKSSTQATRGLQTPDILSPQLAKAGLGQSGLGQSQSVQTAAGQPPAGTSQTPAVGQNSLGVNPTPTGDGFAGDTNDPQSVATTERVAQLQANKDLTGQKAQDRYQAGQAMEGLLSNPDIQKNLNLIGMYDGPGGYAQMQYDKLANPQKYATFQSATQQLGTIIEGSLKVLTSLPSTDSATNLATGYLTKGQQILGSNPAAARAYVQEGLKILSAEYQSVKKAAMPAFNVPREPVSSGSGTAPVKKQQSANSSGFGNDLFNDLQGRSK